MVQLVRKVTLCGKDTYMDLGHVDLGRYSHGSWRAHRKSGRAKNAKTISPAIGQAIDIAPFSAFPVND
jgi:hypothetical protein